MHEKITMLVEELDETISEEFSVGISRDVQASYSYDYSQDVTVECNAEKAADGVGLWQWITTTTDGSSKTYTTHSVCRYGSNYNKSPECPWNACLDGQCTTCDPAWKA